jgi:hypothetical protein
MTEDLLEGLDKRLDRTSFIATAIAAPAVSLLYGSKTGLSILSGAFLSYVNFHWLKQAVDFVVLQGAEGGIGGRVLLRFVGRYALIALFLYVTIRSSLLDLIFVFAGLLVYVLAILVECIYQVCRVVIEDYRNGRT